MMPMAADATASASQQQQSQLMQIQVPQGCSPRQLLQIQAPSGQLPGQSFQVQIPQQLPPGHILAMATCPPGSGAGHLFQILVSGQLLSVTVPAGVEPGMQFQVAVPVVATAVTATTTVPAAAAATTTENPLVNPSADWTELHDSNTQKAYYHNQRTGETSWTRPLDLQPTSQPLSSSLPPPQQQQQQQQQLPQVHTTQTEPVVSAMERGAAAPPTNTTLTNKNNVNAVGIPTRCNCGPCFEWEAIGGAASSFFWLGVIFLIVGATSDCPNCRDSSSFWLTFGAVLVPAVLIVLISVICVRRYTCREEVDVDASNFTRWQPASISASQSAFPLFYSEGAGKITISWSAPPSSSSFFRRKDAAAITTGFEVHMRTNNAGSYVKLGSDELSSATSKTVTGLTNGTPYQFKVFAKNAAGTATKNLHEEGEKYGITRTDTKNPLEGLLKIFIFCPCYLLGVGK